MEPDGLLPLASRLTWEGVLRFGLDSVVILNDHRCPSASAITRNFFVEIEYTGVDFNVVVDPSMNRLGLMTSDAG